MRLLVEGLGPTEIGERHRLSVKTVSTHKTRILDKLGLGSTAELVRRHGAPAHFVVADLEQPTGGPCTVQLDRASRYLISEEGWPIPQWSRH